MFAERHTGRSLAVATVLIASSLVAAREVPYLSGHVNDTASGNTVHLELTPGVSCAGRHGRTADGSNTC